MTFLNTRYKLQRELTMTETERLSALNSVYGIRGISIEGQDLVVEYDASRLHEAEVLATVRRAGIPVQAPAPIPLGGFDYTGQFKDFAWPTEGLSPANRKN